MFGDNDTTTVNTLIATTLDSVDGYRKAAEEAGSHRLAAAFRERAAERETVVRDLQQLVRAHGGNPEDDGTILAAAHRAFLGLRDMFTSARDDEAIIAEVERGESYLAGKYEAAMKATDLNPDVKAAVSKAYASVKSGHDAMAMLKNATY